MLYEAYQSKAAFTAHQQTPHYLKWKVTVADWMAQPRQGVKHNAIFFGDAAVG
jgi:autoinducer 2-degrading protein